MQDLSRARVLQALAAGALVASGSPASAQGAGQEARDIIMIVRHAEKPENDGMPYGITEDGVVNSGSLTVRGWTRAGALANAFMHPDRWGVPTPGAIYASRPGEDKTLRAMETVMPLAKRLGIDVDTSFRRGAEAALANALVAGHGARLVAWEHHSIPDIVAHLGTVTPGLIGLWKANRYDVIWSFTRDGDGWHFRPIAQQLLAGDEATA